MERHPGVLVCCIASAFSVLNNYVDPFDHLSGFWFPLRIDNTRAQQISHLLELVRESGIDYCFIHLLKGCLILNFVINYM